MLRINRILRKSIPFNLKCFLCGCLCCCCTFGLSLGPVFCLNKRVSPLVYSVNHLIICHRFCSQTKARIEKVLAQENWRLYNKVCPVGVENEEDGLSLHLSLPPHLPPPPPPPLPCAQLGLNISLTSEYHDSTNLREYVSDPVQLLDTVHSFSCLPPGPANTLLTKGLTVQSRLTLFHTWGVTGADCNPTSVVFSLRLRKFYYSLLLQCTSPVEMNNDDDNYKYMIIIMLQVTSHCTQTLSSITHAQLVT